MASINYAAREINVKIVYYGPGLSGKTTNLQVIHRKVPPEFKSDMVSLATETDRTLFFDFLPLDLGKIKGFATKFQLYTVPGQVYYNATRKLVLRGVDGVVFVADSAQDKIEENIESFQNLEDNLAEYGYKRENIPIIVQYNKRDLPNALAVEELHKYVNKYNLPWTEAVANKGVGVFDSLKLIGKIVIDYLNKKYSRGPRGGAAPQQRPSRMPPQQQSAPSRQQFSPQQGMQPQQPSPKFNQLGQQPYQTRPSGPAPFQGGQQQQAMYQQQQQPPSYSPQQQGMEGMMPPPQQQQKPRQAPPTQYQPQGGYQPPPPNPAPSAPAGNNVDEPITFEPPQAAGQGQQQPEEYYNNFGSINLEPMEQRQQPPQQQQFQSMNSPQVQQPQMDASGKTDLDLEIERYQREIEEKQRRMRSGAAPQQQQQAVPQQQDYDVYNVESPTFEPQQQQQAQPMLGDGEDEAMFFTSVDTDRHKKPVKRPVNPRTQQQQQQKGFLSKFFNKDMS